MSEYYSPQEIADRLSVSVYTIRRYIRDGKLRAVKLEGTYRVSREDLAAFLKSRQIGASSGAQADDSPDDTAENDLPSDASSSMDEGANEPAPPDDRAPGNDPRQRSP